MGDPARTAWSEETGELRIRLATPDDVSSVAALISESVRGLSDPYYSARQIESGLAYIFGPDTQLIRDGTYFVVESGDRIVGSGGWSRRRTLYGGDQSKSGEDPLLDPAKEPARIRAFFVHPLWARRGIGRRLLNACVEAARAAGFRALELVATLPGEPFYRAFGFEETARYDIRLPDGEGLPVVHMQRSIGGPDELDV